MKCTCGDQLDMSLWGLPTMQCTSKVGGDGRCAHKDGSKATPNTLFMEEVAKCMGAEARTAYPKCVDKAQGAAEDYCSSWCNTAGKFGCGAVTHIDNGYRCDCTGCNGCN